MAKKTPEQVMRMRIAKVLELELQGKDSGVDMGWVDRAMRWLDGAGQKLATPADDPANQAIARLAQAAYADELPELDDTGDDDAAKPQRRTG